MKKSLVVTAIAAAALGLTACGNVEMPAGEQGVRVNGSYLGYAAPEVKDCLKPESQQTIGADDHFDYPARSISFDANSDQGAERGPFEAVTKDAVRMRVPVSITFDLTTNCDLLKEFHRDFGTKYQAWLDDDGNYGQGWLSLVNYVVGQPADATILGVTTKYNWIDVFNNESIRVEYEAALEQQLPKASAARTNGKEMFINWQVTVLKPVPVDGGMLEAIDQAQKDVQVAQGKQRAAAADQQAAIAETLAEQERAKKRAAEIAGFGTGPEAVDRYLRFICQQNPNCHQYDPSPIIAGAR